MPLATLEEIRLLSNLETGTEKLLQIVLFGQPELDQHLALPHMRQLKERITHSFDARAAAAARGERLRELPPARGRLPRSGPLRRRGAAHHRRSLRGPHAAHQHLRRQDAARRLRRGHAHGDRPTTRAPPSPTRRSWSTRRESPRRLAAVAAAAASPRAWCSASCSRSSCRVPASGARAGRRGALRGGAAPSPAVAPAAIAGARACRRSCPWRPPASLRRPGRPRATTPSAETRAAPATADPRRRSRSPPGAS